MTDHPAGPPRPPAASGPTADSPLLIARVAVPGALPQTLCYAVPPHCAGQVKPGCLVTAPLGTRRITGLVWSLEPASAGAAREDDGSAFTLKPLEDLIDTAPVFDAALMGMLRFVSSYYLAPPGEVFSAALPPGLLRESEPMVSLASSSTATPDDDKGPDRAGRRMREVLAGHPDGLPLPQLCRQAKVSASTVRQQASRGLLLLRHSVRRPRAQPKLETFVKAARSSAVLLAEADRLPERCHRQAEILRLLATIPETSLADLVREAPALRNAVEVLAARGLVRRYERRVLRPAWQTPAATRIEDAAAATLTAAQQTALEHISEARDRGGFQTLLLHGVTGSGKTEVYLKAADAMRIQGRTTLVLAPEIALTPQLLARFSRLFGDRVAVWHSSLSPGERLDEWTRIREGQVDVVVGARSAVFAPLPRLGLVVVDEEHESAYKSEERVLYHARDLAVWRARDAGAIALLGSATPSLESWRNAVGGRYGLISMPRRVADRPLPTVELVRLTPRDLKDDFILSSELVVATQQCLSRKEQVILFVPRRGYAPLLTCMACAEAIRCPHCDISLSYHREGACLRCHYCGHEQPLPRRCPSCDSSDLRLSGYGSQRVEDLLLSYFPDVRIARLDRDILRRKGALVETLTAVAAGDVDILVGTQMVTKGHDFHRVTLVGVINADHSMNFPDFRAMERSFQLLTQVAGRAGRGEQPGRVIVQTMNPDHPLFSFVRNQDYPAFARYELQRRAEAGYPPFAFLLRLLLTGPDDETVTAASQRLLSLCLNTTVARENQRSGALRFMGPVAAPLGRLKDLFRRHLIVAAASRGALTALAGEIARRSRELELPAGVAMRLDMDPQQLL